MDGNIVWPEVFRRLPWITRLGKGHKCQGFMSGTPLKAIFQGPGLQKVTDEELVRLREKYSCKNAARWKFKELKRSPGGFSHGRTRLLCWSHLVHQGIFGNMDEEARTLRWFKRHDSDIYERIRPREFEPTDG